MASLRRLRTQTVKMSASLQIADTIRAEAHPAVSFFISKPLTVNAVTGTRFAVNIIPHTAAVTGFATLAVGDTVNVEVDLLARYAARLLEVAQ